MGLLTLISLGPGHLDQLTGAALKSLQDADILIGYAYYLDLIRPLRQVHQEILVSQLGQEIDRASQAIALAKQDNRVALISSGDVGLYAMAGPVFDVLAAQNWQGDLPEVQLLPGVSAIQAAAAKLGSPIAHDFCTISLSDLLTPWSVIERRVLAAAWGDFVVGFYNPRSQKRDWQLQRAVDILLSHRVSTTPVALARNVTRPDETLILTTLAELDCAAVDMFTLVIVGNSQSYELGGEYFVTPRGYTKYTVSNHDLQPQPEKKIASNQTIYPVMLTQVNEQLAIVVGGGSVGERKVNGLLQASAQVRLISPRATPQLQVWTEANQIEWQQRPYQRGDLQGATLAFAATNQRAINATVADEARLLGILCNVADAPAEGNFHVPAIHRQDEVMVAVGTSGTSPKRAKAVRDEIAEQLARS